MPSFIHPFLHSFPPPLSLPPHSSLLSSPLIPPSLHSFFIPSLPPFLPLSLSLFFIHSYNFQFRCHLHTPAPRSSVPSGPRWPADPHHHLGLCQAPPVRSRWSHLQLLVPPVRSFVQRGQARKERPLPAVYRESVRGTVCPLSYGARQYQGMYQPNSCWINLTPSLPSARSTFSQTFLFLGIW